MLRCLWSRCSKLQPDHPSAARDQQGSKLEHRSQVCKRCSKTLQCCRAVQEVPSGPPPVLSIGDDDIFWVNQLQVRTTALAVLEPLHLMKQKSSCSTQAG